LRAIPRRRQGKNLSPADDLHILLRRLRRAVSGTSSGDEFHLTAVTPPYGTQGKRFCELMLADITRRGVFPRASRAAATAHLAVRPASPKKRPRTVFFFFPVIIREPMLATKRCCLWKKKKNPAHPHAFGPPPPPPPQGGHAAVGFLIPHPARRCFYGTGLEARIQPQPWPGRVVPTVREADSAAGGGSRWCGSPATKGPRPAFASEARSLVIRTFVRRWAHRLDAVLVLARGSSDICGGGVVR